jgi:hypothetical protein
MNKCLPILFAICGLARGQNQNVTVSKQAPSPATTTLTYYTASGNPQYICKAQSNQPQYTWAVTPSSQQGTLTSIVVLTNVGTATTSANHGLQVNDVVIVAGSTTAALNGTYIIQTVPSATTFTITTSGVGNATYATAALAMSTMAPRSNAPIWSIEQYTYGTSGGANGNPIADQWAVTVTGGGGSAQTFSCDNRQNYGFH